MNELPKKSPFSTVVVSGSSNYAKDIREAARGVRVAHENLVEQQRVIASHPSKARAVMGTLHGHLERLTESHARLGALIHEAMLSGERFDWNSILNDKLEGGEPIEGTSESVLASAVERPRLDPTTLRSAFKAGSLAPSGLGMEGLTQGDAELGVEAIKLVQSLFVSGVPSAREASMQIETILSEVLPHLEAWESLEPAVDHAVISYVTARFRLAQEVQGAARDPRCVRVAGQLGEHMKRTMHGVVHGLARSHTPVRGESWFDDATYWSERMADLMGGGPEEPEVGNVIIDYEDGLARLHTELAHPGTLVRKARKRVMELISQLMRAGLDPDDANLVDALASHPELLEGFAPDELPPIFDRVQKVLQGSQAEAAS